MTSQISKNIVTHVILTYAGSKIFINSILEKQLRSLNDNDKIYVDNRTVRINTIKEILPIDEYYKEHPEERPQYNNYTAEAIHFTKYLPFNEKRRKRALEQMIKGFKDHFIGREIPPQSKSLLEKMEARLKLI